MFVNIQQFILIYGYYQSNVSVLLSAGLGGRTGAVGFPGLVGGMVFADRTGFGGGVWDGRGSKCVGKE